MVMMLIMMTRLLVTNRISTPKNPYKYFLVLLCVSISVFNSLQCMEEELAPDIIKCPGAAVSFTVPSLQELCAKKLKDGINWQRRPLRQVARLYKANRLVQHGELFPDVELVKPEEEEEEEEVLEVSRGVTDEVWGEVSSMLIKQGIQPLSCTPLTQDTVSRSADGSIGILISRHNKQKHRITIIDDDNGIIGYFTEKKPLEQALMSLDGRYVLTLKNKKGRETDKKQAYVKIWESQHQTCLGHYRFIEEVQKISCVDDTDHIVLKVDERTQYLATIQALLKKHRGVNPKLLDLDRFDRMRLISLSEAAKQDPKKFYDTTDGVWNAKNPKTLFPNFIDLESSFEEKSKDNPSYFHISPSGLFLAHGDSTGTLNIWNIEKKEIIAMHNLGPEESIKRVAWRIHDKITVLTSQHRYQFDLRDLLVGLFLEKTLDQTETQESTIATST